MNLNLVITQTALLTPLGDAAATWEGICANRRIENACAVPEQLLDPDDSLDRSIRLGLAVARRALADKPGKNLALFCGTSKGPVGIMLGALDKTRRNELPTPAQATQIALGVGAIGAILRDRLQIDGPAHTSVAACSSGMFALHRAARAIQSGECDRALVVAADASLYPLFESSFQRLGVLAPNQRCEPYDPSGAGFFVAEAAAAVLLEKSVAGLALEHTAIAADSTGLIAVDPHTRSLRYQLAQCPAENLAFVHGHGTGTAHDLFELAAIRETLPPSLPLFSHKQWLGHSLGSAGLVGVVLSAMCHHHRRLPDATPLPQNARSLTIAQGFGGHIGLVILRDAN